MSPIVAGRFVAPDDPIAGATAELDKNVVEVASILPSGKARADFFVAVRARGMLNAILEQAEDFIIGKYPGSATRWEYSPPNGDEALVTAREALGYRVVQNSELATSTNKPGPVRRGDLVLMVGPKEMADELGRQDATAAYEDLHGPERAYYDSLNRNKVITKSGSEDQAVPFGTIKTVTETKTAVVDRSGEVRPS